jgi:hypothetical protein
MNRVRETLKVLSLHCLLDHVEIFLHLLLVLGIDALMDSL